MSLFGLRTPYDSDPSFTPLFRLLDDFDNYSREVQGAGDETGRESGRQRRKRGVRTFTPKFDIRETENNYELHGELPGIERDDVIIEFTDPQTIVIRGRIERNYGLVEGGSKSGGEPQHTPHKVTVEEEGAEEAKEKAKEKGASTEVTKGPEATEEKQEKPKAAFEKYWAAERSIGEFNRSFSFPTRVDHDGVTANLKNGILTVIVPKAKKHETRRIAIH
ncbi:heat shock protein 30 [Diplogelasinospora grovesii]|uniref:Heat shock protein 30 n=1 Tax=Diplogelasinospora grovesii TaxID=303347 RepID=A0AAN6N9U5_9PEZI|nr:heat shock protein 30 [Diplogelasinospora grovesii]